ncbi:MAG: DUF2508 family protein [Clostridia bacterium]|nr:DUF2508 family protein [Clostridia bacterium]
MVKTLKNLTEKLNVLHNSWQKRIRTINEGLMLKENTVNAINEETKDYSLVNMIEDAHSEWEQAITLFNEARDPELVDHAIYAMKAAERKYMYLLKQAREEKVIDTNIYYLENGSLV